MEWLREWAKPAVVIVAIGVFATYANNNINRCFDSMDNRLQAVEKTIFEMNTRLSRIEGKLDIAVTAPGNESSPADLKK